MEKIALLTSGGDAPGMNAVIRSVVRTAIHKAKTIIGVKGGFEGLIDGDFMNMDFNSVSDIIQRGGTILKTSRSEHFRTKEGMLSAAQKLKEIGIEGLILLGGDGTFKGAHEFAKISEIPAIGIPCTIDNDLSGTDFTIGYDTALNTVIQAVDKIRDTASSHHRLFFIEVMGRDAGFIALHSGIAVGAEDILIPEAKTDINNLVARLDAGRKKNKSSFIVIVAEGEEPGGVFEIARKVRERYNYIDIRITVIGHMQRGGNPTCFDRVLASRLGVEATERLLGGYKNEMAGLIKGEISFTPFSEIKKHLANKNTDNLLQIARMLSL